jgi:hypothetical protein
VIAKKAMMGKEREQKNQSNIKKEIRNLVPRKAKQFYKTFQVTMIPSYASMTSLISL